LGSNLIMTRLLMPEMFGVMALANVILAGLHLFTDIGLGQNIVQSARGSDPRFLNTAWTLQIIRGALVWGLALAASLGVYLLAAFHFFPANSAYVEPVLPAVMAVISFNALIGSLVSTRMATANRTLNLGRITQIELASQIAALVLMVVWTYIDRSVWALVAGSLVSSALRVYLSFAMLPGEKNVLHWDRHAFHEILGYGKWIFLTSVLGFLAANGDRLLLGGLVSTSTLGLYSIAFFMVSATQDLFSKLIGNVAFPAFSEVFRDRREMLKQTYYKFRLPIDVMTLLISGIFFTAGHLLIQILYDTRYHDAGHMVEILSIALFETRFSLAGQCFMAMGNPKLLVPIILIRLVALFVLMPVSFHFWGLGGALWVAGGSVLFTLPYTLYLKWENGLLDGMREIAVLPLFALGCLIGKIFDQAYGLFMTSRLH
jgi:O-antigen/teichoic acid export membrane protein